MGLDASYILTADVTISAAELVLLRATPKVLVAGVAGSVIEPISVQSMLDFGVAAYNAPGAGDDLEIRRAGGGPVWAIQESTGLVNAGADAHRLIAPAMPNTAGVYDTDIAAAVGVALEIRNNGAAEYVNPGTAAGVLRVRTRYRLHVLDLSV